MQLIQLLDGSRKVRFRQTVFQNEGQRVLYKLVVVVLVTDPLYHSERIYNNPSNFGIIQKPTKFNLLLFITIT